MSKVRWYTSYVILSNSSSYPRLQRLYNQLASNKSKPWNKIMNHLKTNVKGIFPSTFMQIKIHNVSVEQLLPLSSTT